MIDKINDFVRKLWISELRCKSNHCDPLEISGRTLILAPHPDDEVFGCGGLIARMVAMGQSPYIVILSGGGASHADCCDISKKSIVEERRKLTREALLMLNFPLENLFEFDFQDGRISEKNEAEIEKLKKLVNELQPANILVPHKGEGWPDHLAAREIGLTFEDANLYEYCVWMWYYHQKILNWQNGRILRLSDEQRDQKRAAIKSYVEPKAPCGNPWSGVLPEVLIQACSWDKELYFKLR